MHQWTSVAEKGWMAEWAYSQFVELNQRSDKPIVNALTANCHSR
jgi:hypothetical protein